MFVILTDRIFTAVAETSFHLYNYKHQSVKCSPGGAGQWECFGFVSTQEKMTQLMTGSGLTLTTCALASLHIFQREWAMTSRSVVINTRGKRCVAVAGPGGGDPAAAPVTTPLQSWKKKVGAESSSYDVRSGSAAFHQTNAAVAFGVAHPEETHAPGQRGAAAQHAGRHQCVRDRERR